MGSEATAEQGVRQIARGWRTAGIAVALVLVAVALFQRGLSAPFIFDDMDSIVGNQAIRAWWPPARLLAAPREANALAGRPLVSASLAFSYAISGLDVRGYHAFSLLLHAVNGLLLFGVLRRTFARHEPWRARADGLAAAVSLLWLVHPLQTEPVVYAVQRTELMMAAFYLGTLYASIRAWEPGHPQLYRSLAVLLCGLGMATKEVMVTAPIVVVLYDRAFVTGSLGEAFRRRLAFYASLGATWLVLAALLSTGEQLRVAGPVWRADLSFQYLLVQGKAILHYLQLAVWPDTLRIVYDWPVRGNVAQFGVYALATGAVACAALAALWRNAEVGFLGACFFLILAPSSSVMPLPTEVLAERRMHLPLAAVLTLVVLLVDEALRRLLRSRRPARLALSAALLASVGVALVVRSAVRLSDFATVVGLWEGESRKSPGNAIARCNLGRALLEEGRVEEAKASYQTCMQLAPQRPSPYQALGVIAAREGRPEQAERLLRESVRLDPGGSAFLFTLARFLAVQGKNPEEAETLYRRGLILHPEDWEAQAQLGRLLLARGRTTEAVACLQEALRLAPQDPVQRDRIALALGEAGLASEAERELQRLLRSFPGDAVLHNDLGTVLGRAGRRDEAIRCWQRALELRPSYAVARYNLASALAAEGRRAEAVAQLRAIVVAVDTGEDVRSRASARLATLEAGDGGRSAPR